MDALEQAQSKLWEAQSAYDVSEAKDGNAFYRELSEMYYRQAAIYAAVAQAEQLSRIADALERVAGAPMAEGIVNPEVDDNSSWSVYQQIVRNADAARFTASE